MNKMMKACVLALLCVALNANAKPINFQDPAQGLNAYVRMRADSTGKDSVTYWKGSAFVVIPGETPKRTFAFEGFNVAKMVRNKAGEWQMISREYSVYRDPKTNAILKTWDNPYTKETNQVFHVQNDPVNHTLGKPEQARPMGWEVMGGDVRLGFDVPLGYPNPIDPKLYPKQAQHTMYTGSEHFGFFADLKDFENKKLTSVPVNISWARTSPWMPWMEMGDRPGYLVFSAWGKKLKSVNELSPDLLAYVKEVAPKYLSAPTEFTTPNATTWTEYKRMVLEKK
jgi:Protein of unknown function (DUF1838)